MRREKNMTHLQNFMEIPILQRKNIFCLFSKGGNLYRMLLFMFQDRNKKKNMKQPPSYAQLDGLKNKQTKNPFFITPKVKRVKSAWVFMFTGMLKEIQLC